MKDLISQITFLIVTFYLMSFPAIGQNHKLDSIFTIKKEVLQQKQKLNFDNYSSLIINNKQRNQERAIINKIAIQKKQSKIGFDSFNLDFEYDSLFIMKVEDENDKSYISLLLLSYYSKNFYLINVDKYLNIVGFLDYQFKYSDINYDADNYDFMSNRFKNKDKLYLKKKKFRALETSEITSNFANDEKIVQITSHRIYDKKNNQLVNYDNRSENYIVKDSGLIIKE